MSADLATRRLRASDAFVLLGLDDLEPAEQKGLGILVDDPEFYGLLKPKNPRLPAKSVSKEAALLLLTLQRARRVPALLASIFGGDLGPLHALLADGVLEVEQDGVFVSGLEALSLFAPAPSTPSTSAQQATSRLSQAAIECAASYEGLDAGTLAEKIYAFGRLPCAEPLRRRFENDAALLSFLAVEDGVASVLASSWVREGDADAGLPWLSFSTRSPTPPLSHKLYVSARLDAMPPLFAMAVRALKRTRCAHFKIGRGGEGVCRPDKMVAYFSTLDRLRECAALIEDELSASDVPPTSAQGVPFTASIDAAGFLSWGMDPPSLAHATNALDAQSWRGWIASRVAVAVLSAAGADAHTDVVPFVLRRIELDGIDPHTWAPTLAIWREFAARSGDVA
jgi:hypothetical protein